MSKKFKTITFANLKGGSNKTTMCFNIGSILAEKDKVLFIDVDPQANLSADCGVDTADRTMKSSRDIFTKGQSPNPQDLIIKSPIINSKTGEHVLPNLDIIPANIQMFFDEDALITTMNRERKLLTFLDKNEEFFNRYKYIIMDTNPSMNIWNINAFYCSDSIILCMNSGSNSLTGAEMFCALWDEKRTQLEKEDNIKALIVGNVRKNTFLSKDLLNYLKQYEFSKSLYVEPAISQSVIMEESELAQRPLVSYAKNHKLTEDLRTLTKNLKKEGCL